MVTFPFFFGLMFGDIGHGLLLFSASALICLYADKLRGTALEGFVVVRYMLLLMGIFAVFSGFIYNDMMSMPLNLFGSCWNMPEEKGESATLVDDCIYTFGIDPAWYVATNELQFMNSLKMKLSVIYGVA